MKFWQALKEMQETGKRYRVVSVPEVFYFWGDVLDIPCLKNSRGEEVLANSWLMTSEWESAS